MVLTTKEKSSVVSQLLINGYILAVNPQVLSLAGVKGISGDMKMDQGAIFVATALAAFVGSFIHGTDCKISDCACSPGWG